METKIYFSDFFDVDPEKLEEEGFVNISLINDLPLFVDPFLLFGSNKSEYQTLHKEIINYVIFLRDLPEKNNLDQARIKHLYSFPEVKQNWFGYSKTGNSGSGLGKKFADSLNDSLTTVFKNFGAENTSEGSHIEKLSLIREGVGRDNISDFTNNLIKSYLLSLTQKFSADHIDPKHLKTFQVNKAYFDYKLKRWMPKSFVLPALGNDFVLLTPKDLLTKDEIWINRVDMLDNFRDVANSLPNGELRSALSDYFMNSLPSTPTKDEYNSTIRDIVTRFPDYIDYYIKYKEDNADIAKINSAEKVDEVESVFIRNVKRLVNELSEKTTFYTDVEKTSFEEAHGRLMHLKSVIEDQDGYRIFYSKGLPIKREHDVQLLFKLAWYASEFDVNAEPNNGRGPVDFSVSKGADDKTLVEFKIAGNSRLRQNLEKQVDIYKKANNTDKAIKAIMYFDDKELARVQAILQALDLHEGKELVLIDARPNKISGSKA